MSSKPCKEESCGSPVVFAKDVETGKWQVLSNQAPIWMVVGAEKGTGIPLVKREPKALLSHFVNCRNPGKFSKAKQEQPAAPIPQRDFIEPKESDDLF